MFEGYFTTGALCCFPNYTVVKDLPINDDDTYLEIPKENTKLWLHFTTNFNVWRNIFFDFPSHFDFGKSNKSEMTTKAY